MSHDYNYMAGQLHDAYSRRNIRLYEHCVKYLCQMISDKEEAKKEAEEAAKRWETKYKKLETEKDEAVSKYEQSLKTNELNLVKIKTLDKEMKKQKEENKQLNAERDEANLNYQQALKTIETKSLQIETVDKEIKRIKRKFKDLCTSDNKLEEKSNAVEKESTEVSEKSDEALITKEWKYFHEKFQKLHNNLTSILHKTAEARNSNVLLENMKIVKELSEVAETVRRDFLSVTEKCSESIEDVLERLFPSDSNSEDETQNPDEKRDCGLLD